MVGVVTWKEYLKILPHCGDINDAGIGVMAEKGESAEERRYWRESGEIIQTLY